MLRGILYYLLACAWLLGAMLGLEWADKYFKINELPGLLNSIFWIVIGVVYFLVTILIFWIGLFSVELRSVPSRLKKFSLIPVLLFLKEKLIFLWLWSPVILIYVVAPLVLVTFIGAWVFLIFPVWVIGNYIYAENWAKNREHMPFLEHTEAIGLMIGVFFPTLLSLLGTLIYYFW
jgi:hypothetical protein